MKRPKQHITETASKKLFENIIPDEWVVREINPDYGIDYLIELFKNSRSTGKFFFVQLKGSNNEIKDDTYVARLSIEHLEYYNSMSLPVILMCTSIKTRQLWGIWADKLIDVNRNKKNKTISIILSKDYLLDKSNVKKIGSQLNFVTKLGVVTYTDSDLTKNLNTHFMGWLENYYQDTISFNFNNLPNQFIINYISTENSVNIKLTINGVTKTVYINRLNENQSFLYRPQFDSNEINEFNIELLVSIAIALAKYNIKGSLNLLTKLISKSNTLNNKIVFDLDYIGLMILAKNEDLLSLYNKLVLEVIKLEQLEVSLLFDITYFIVGFEELEEYRIENLYYMIESTSDKELLAICHYNLGNILREKEERKAINHYLKATKLFPDYKNRYYWWQEFAGLLFSQNRFRFAEKFYKKSLELSREGMVNNHFYRVEKKLKHSHNIIFAFIADCLFFQGKFKEANKYFLKYLDETEIRIQEWVLKYTISQELGNSSLDNVPFNKELSMQLCKESDLLSDPNEIIKNMLKALEYFPTNGLAWFNLGIAQNKIHNNEESFFSFLAAGLFQGWDKEAQINALMLSINLNELKITQSILIYILDQHGDLIINDISDFIMNQETPLVKKNSILNVFKELLKVARTLKDTNQI